MPDYTALLNDDNKLNEYIKFVIAISNSYNHQQAVEFKQLISHYQAGVLSYISILNSRTRLVMHLIGKLQRTDLVDAIERQVRELLIPSDLVTDTILISSRVAAFVEKIGSYKSSIESSIPNLASPLNIYSDSTTESGINLIRESEKQPIYMNYLSARNMIATLTGLNSINNNYQNDNESERETKIESIIHKPIVLLTEMSENISNLLSIVSTTNKIIEAVDILEALYSYVPFANKSAADSFFNSKYDTIKATTIKAIS